MGRKGFFILALIFGLIAAGSAYQYLQSINQVSIPELRPLVLAKSNIPARSMIRADQLIVKEIPLNGYPQGGAKTIQSVTGTVALVNLNPGDPVLEVMFQRQSKPEGTQISASSTVSNPLVDVTPLVVPKGKRAVAIPIGLVSGVGYAVRPGDYVDILVTIDVKDTSADKSQTTITTLAAQDVLVLSVGDSPTVIKDKADSKAAESKFYTLALSVPQALTVTLGSEKGNLRLLLRNPVNQEMREDQAISPSIFLDPNYFKRFQ
ncbi:MAG: Flp pilus assembly protein CpaB [Desulfitobacteriaceae bacterium]